MMAVPVPPDYFREAQSWDADRAAQFRRNARLAWWVAGAGWICAVAGCIVTADSRQEDADAEFWIYARAVVADGSDGHSVP